MMLVPNTKLMGLLRLLLIINPQPGVFWSKKPNKTTKMDNKKIKEDILKATIKTNK